MNKLKSKFKSFCYGQCTWKKTTFGLRSLYSYLNDLFILGSPTQSFNSPDRSSFCSVLLLPRIAFVIIPFCYENGVLRQPTLTKPYLETNIFRKCKVISCLALKTIIGKAPSGYVY